MLEITIPKTELFNEQIGEFVSIEETTLRLEHSLVSLSKWESKWHQAFLDETIEKSYEQTIDYIKCMTLTQNVKDEVYLCLTPENVKQITDYIADPMTATKVPNSKREGQGRSKKKDVMTSERIYYAMIAQQIPVEFQKWHLNRLLTLINLCSYYNTPKGKRPKMGKREVASRNAALNAARRKQLNTKG